MRLFQEFYRVYCPYSRACAGRLRFKRLIRGLVDGIESALWGSPGRHQDLRRCFNACLESLRVVLKLFMRLGDKIETPLMVQFDSTGG